MTRKICIVTGTRAEYGLLRWMMRDIDDEAGIQLQIIATAMHLSPEFGFTYREIEADGFVIDNKVDMLLSADTSVGVTKSMGVGLIGLADVLADLRPDIIVVLGDRFEMFCAASAATVLRIPIAHLHGGELTQGSIDDVFRHSITKMANIHFTSTEQYRRRVIQLGECPDHVLNVGALGVENLNRLDLLDRKQLEQEVGLLLGERSLLVTYHPETSNPDRSHRQFETMLEAIETLDTLSVIFTKSNADAGGRRINQLIDSFVKSSRQNVSVHSSLGQQLYLSALKHVNGVVGNSSSGIIEAPSLKTGTINIGTRQEGRIRADSVIDCEPELEDIQQAIEMLFTREFQKRVKTVQNPYHGIEVSKTIVQFLKHVSLNSIAYKQFFDLSITTKELTK